MRRDCKQCGVRLSVQQTIERRQRCPACLQRNALRASGKIIDREWRGGLCGDSWDRRADLYRDRLYSEDTLDGYRGVDLSHRLPSYDWSN